MSVVVLSSRNGRCLVAGRHAAKRISSVACSGSSVGDTSNSISATARPWPLAVSRQLAAARRQEMQRSQPLLTDVLADGMAQTLPNASATGLGASSRSNCDVAADVVATKFLDDMLMRAMDTTSLNTIAEGDFHQVVLLGDGLDTRPFRLTWPSGTVFFVVASKEVHELAVSVLKQHKSAVPPGCLLRRVKADLQQPTSWASTLLNAGFRGDRVSVWALQGLAGLELSRQQLQALLSDVAECAAYGSLVLGELPAMPAASAADCLAEAGLMASLQPHSVVGERYGRKLAGRQESSAGCASSAGPDELRSATAGQRQGLEADSEVGINWRGEDGVDDAGGTSMASVAGVGEGAVVDGADGTSQRWLFTSQQQKLSAEQVGIYERHAAEAEMLDEDAGDLHFS